MQKLSRRELQIVSLMVGGNKPGQIVASLEISPATFGTHRGRILLKTGCRTDAQLGAWAERNQVAAA